MANDNRKLDMSLDDIIRMDNVRGARKFNSRGNSNRRRAPMTMNRSGFGGGAQMGGDRRRIEPKRLSGGGSGGGQFSQNRNRNFAQAGRYQQSDGGRGFGTGGYKQQNGFHRNQNQNNSSYHNQNNNTMNNSNNRPRNATLHVSNLAPTVNSEDIEELFSTFGPLVRSFVHYDQHGVSVGTADVIFENRNDAIEVRNKLNSVPLDGKPLRIVLIDDDGSANDPFSSYLRAATRPRRSSGPPPIRSNMNHQRQSNGNRNNAGGNRRGPPPSAEDLDREMDEWRMQVDSDAPKIGNELDGDNYL